MPSRRAICSALMLACSVACAASLASAEDAPASPRATAATAAVVSTATSPATTRAAYSVDLARFDDEALHAPLRAFEAWVSHLATDKVDDAVAMMLVAPRADGNVHRRACRNLSREYRKPGGAPHVIAGRVVGNTALLLLAHPSVGNRPPVVRRFYLLRRDDDWRIVAFNIAIVVEIYADEEFRTLQDLEDWAFRREQDLKPGTGS